MKTNLLGQKVTAYKFGRGQELSPRNIIDRVISANRLGSLGDQFGPGVYDNIWWSDECHFEMVGYRNSQNQRWRAVRNPRWVLTVGHHPLRATCWMSFSANGGTIGPFWIIGNIDGERYRQLLIDQVFPAMQQRCVERGLDMNEQWFQQDGAPPHTAHESIALLQATFGQRVISRGLEIAPWPGNSPDLNPCDFFLWGFLKMKVFQGRARPANLANLRNRVEAACMEITPQMLMRVCQSVMTRLAEVILVDGLLIRGKVAFGPNDVPNAQPINHFDEVMAQVIAGGQ